MASKPMIVVWADGTVEDLSVVFSPVAESGRRGGDERGEPASLVRVIPTAPAVHSEAEEA